MLAALCAVFCGWWAFKSAVVLALVNSNPFAAAAVAPNDPRVKMKLARTEFDLRNGRVSPASREAAIDALERASLAEDPFLLAGVQAIADGKGQWGDRLLEESRRRNPRSRLTRLLLVDRYLRSGRTEGAGIELAALARLIPNAVPALSPELASMVLDRNTRTPTVRLLAEQPPLQDAVLTQLAQSGAPVDLVLGVASAGGRMAGGPDWQRILISRMVENGQVGEAYDTWRRLTKVAGASRDEPVYDPHFSGLPGPAPFNWDLTSGSEGVAERTSAPALQASYYGRTAVTLARQLLMLPPGRYMLQFRAEGDAKGEASKLVWNVTCFKGGSRLLQIPLTGIGSPRRVKGSFSVPAGACLAQWLSLDGAPGDVASEESVTVTDFELRREGGR